MNSRKTHRVDGEVESFTRDLNGVDRSFQLTFCPFYIPYPGPDTEIFLAHE